MTDTDALVEELARAIANNIGQQDYDGWKLDADTLKVDYLDQGEVDFGEVARAILPIIERIRTQAAEG